MPTLGDLLSKKTKQKTVAPNSLGAMASRMMPSADDNDIITDKIINIESAGNPNAYNKRSGAMGLMQIMPNGALADWNTINRDSRHTPDQMNDPQINSKIGTWYLNERIPQMMQSMNLPDSVDNRLIAYNAGIGNLRKILAGKMQMPKETSDYIKKYRR